MQNVAGFCSVDAAYMNTSEGMNIRKFQDTICSV
jgi:hypothetical protein